MICAERQQCGFQRNLSVVLSALSPSRTWERAETVPSLPVRRCPGCATPATEEMVRAGCSGQIPAFGGGSSQGMLAQRAPPAAPTTLEAERRPLGGGWQLPCPTWSPASSHRDIAAIAGGVRAQSPKVPIWDSKRCWVISSLVMPSTKVPCFGDLKHHRC